jgi:hypothetical protein
MKNGQKDGVEQPPNGLKQVLKNPQIHKYETFFFTKFLLFKLQASKTTIVNLPISPFLRQFIYFNTFVNDNVKDDLKLFWLMHKIHVFSSLWLGGGGGS